MRYFQNPLKFVPANNRNPKVYSTKFMDTTCKTISIHKYCMHDPKQWTCISSSLPCTPTYPPKPIFISNEATHSHWKIEIECNTFVIISHVAKKKKLMSLF